MSNTSAQYDDVVSKCTEIFKNKTIDYENVIGFIPGLTNEVIVILGTWLLQPQLVMSLSKRQWLFK